MAREKSKHDFVVGFEGDGNVRYGKDDYMGRTMYIDPLTLYQAKKEVRKLKDGDARIFQLIDVTDAVIGEGNHA